ncbi:HK97 family phage prohead protease [Stappia sp. F7233]|uniref:HK97 family phage prohead protease n=1 Tax=Stappia albiluteola TaxID=2758565 RepID=A0A839AKD4_9HYPH|nr:HK97 family phage prohead protease [Stappia albiluteola]MBA5779488.1 HK97 family phage prohead protease [Stappia albiluteola]
MDRIEVKFAADGIDEKTGTFSGYGAVFGNIDSYGDVIAKGAFRQTLRDWKREKKLPAMLLQHGGWGMTDTDGLPVGVWTLMEEDDTGLRAEGRLINLDTERGKSIYGAMKEGVLDGLSIGYRAKEFALGTKPDEPRRTLKAVDLFEVSIVTFPANGKARVGAVKSAEGIKTIREFEEFLRDAGGFSHARAKAIASQGFKGSEPRDEDVAGIAALIRRNIDKLS